MIGASVSAEERLKSRLEVARKSAANAVNLTKEGKLRWGWTGPTYLVEQRSAFERLGLSRQAAHITFRSRCDFIETELGLREITLSEAGAMLCGKSMNFRTLGDFEDGIAGFRTRMYKPSIGGSGSPNNAEVAIHAAGGWRGHKYRTGGLEDLVVAIPYGVALLYQEMIGTGVFDYFEVLAPSKSFAVGTATLPAKPKSIDPVLMGVVVGQQYYENRYEMLKEPTARYFLAKWGD